MKKQKKVVKINLGYGVHVVDFDSFLKLLGLSESEFYENYDFCINTWVIEND